MARDIAIAFGFVKRPIGRLLAPPRYVANLEPALADLDRAMVEVDSMLVRLGRYRQRLRNPGIVPITRCRRPRFQRQPIDS